MKVQRDLDFIISPEVKQIGVRVIAARLVSLHNRSGSPDFDRYKTQLAHRLRVERDPSFIKTDEVLEGFRQLHTRIGLSRQAQPAASEALLRLLLRKGVIPTVNLLVDIYNCVSLETRLALGAHDVARLDGNIVLRLTNGTESFQPLGAPAPEPVKAGEYAYIEDNTNTIICRLECKQVEKTKVTETTTDCFYILQGNHKTPCESLHAALNELVELTAQFCSGSVAQVWDEA
jgi:DNA/RNA-binding domain of Phe-tRNA-synthetase-like protein